MSRILGTYHSGLGGAAVPHHRQAHARAFVEPSKRNADIIVPNGGENTAAVEMLAHHIRNLIEKANMM